MKPHLPQRSLIRSALTLQLQLQHPPQTRSLILGYFRGNKRAPPLDPLSADFLKKKPTASASALPPAQGDLAPSSIFESQDATSRPPLPPSPTGRQPEQQQPLKRDPISMAAALDPQPLARARWQRKMLIRDIKHRYRPSKTTLLLRTERSIISPSHMLKTSIKKLGPLARQIAGKPIEDAMVQMRFSKKRVAKDVLKHLQYVKDEAVVRRGMGLGSGNIAAGAQTAEGKSQDTTTESKGILVEDKEGKKRWVKDPTQMYIDEAWVGRGKYGEAPDFRAYGRIYIMKLPWTNITIKLKEEATRIRLMKEREEKRLRKKVWVQLPNRPVTAQRQYCLW